MTGSSKTLSTSVKNDFSLLLWLRRDQFTGENPNERSQFMQMVPDLSTFLIFSRVP